MKYTKDTYPICPVCLKKMDCREIKIMACHNCSYSDINNCAKHICSCDKTDLYKEITKLNQRIIELEDNICRLKKTIKERLF